ncbi:hypothetical protein CFO_g3879 [Ceratocystis platani]|uniref:Uncharacterized protein n=1 Tax=Ceratocystis fimbriata f. sp. platani TaxID=88771 RepID=A0A0F8AZ73_CERFI|nr:hypothetical protein CFO_g3879 [Ceratocystis platani]
MGSSDNVNVPAAAGSYSAATIDTDLRTSINMTLLRDGHVNKIQEHLLQSLNSNSADWPTLVQNHALTLLRNGEASSFPDLLRRVLDDVRAANSPASLAALATADPGSPSATTNGSSSTRDKDKEKEKDTDSIHGSSESTNGDGLARNGGSTSAAPANGNFEAGLALPRAVVQSALRVTRDCLEDVVTVDE